jgi:hypothetical protein
VLGYLLKIKKENCATLLMNDKNELSQKGKIPYLHKNATYRVKFLSAETGRKDLYIVVANHTLTHRL